MSGLQSRGDHTKKTFCQFSRIAVLTVLSIVFSLNSVIPMTYAQDWWENWECGSCNTMPIDLEEYIWTMKELIQVLDQTQDNALPGIRVPSFTENYLKKVLQQTILSQGISPMITVLNATAISYQDIYLNTALLFGSESRKRDRDRLQDLDMLLMHKSLALWTAWTYYKAVPKAKLDEFDSKLQKLGYVRLAKSWESYNFKKTYGALLRTLRHMQNFYKDMHMRKRYTEYFRDLGDNFYKSYVNPDDTQQKKIENELAKQLVDRITFITNQYLQEWLDGGKWQQLSTLEIDMPRLVTHIRNIEKDYRCSVGAKDECGALADIHKESRDLVRDRVAKDTSSAMNTFKDAISRLKGEFRSEAANEDKIAAEQRKQALLRSQRWYNGGREGAFDFVDGHVAVDDAPSTKAAAKDISQRRRSHFGNEQRATRLGATLGTPEREVGKGRLQSRGKVSTVPDQGQKWWARTDRKYPGRYSTEEERYAYFMDVVDEYESQQQNSNIDAVAANLQWSQQKYIIGQLVGSMQTSFDQVLNLQDSRRWNALYTDPSQVTYLFPQLSQAVYKSIEMLGEKNKETPEGPSLVKWLGEMCELQCPWLWGKRCAYYQD